jgi:prolyl-tRNA synthetase
MKPGDAACDASSEDVYTKMTAAGLEPLLEDTDQRPGAKFAAMDLIGLPWQVVVGPRGVAAGIVEVKNRRSGEKQELTPDAALNLISGKA